MTDCKDATRKSDDALYDCECNACDAELSYRGFIQYIEEKRAARRERMRPLPSVVRDNVTGNSE